MPKMVCVKCEVEFRPETNGTIVVETASFGPYKVWRADTWKCPKCEVEVVAGFGERPWRDDVYKDDFPSWLNKVLAKAARVVYDNER